MVTARPNFLCVLSPTLKKKKSPIKHIAKLSPNFNSSFSWGWATHPPTRPPDRESILTQPRRPEKYGIAKLSTQGQCRVGLVLISTKEAAETLAHVKVNVFDSQLSVEQSIQAFIQPNINPCNMHEPEPR